MSIFFCSFLFEDYDLSMDYDYYRCLRSFEGYSSRHSSRTEYCFVGLCTGVAMVILYGEGIRPSTLKG